MMDYKLKNLYNNCKAFGQNTASIMYPKATKNKHDVLFYTTKLI